MTERTPKIGDYVLLHQEFDGLRAGVIGHINGAYVLVEFKNAPVAFFVEVYPNELDFITEEEYFKRLLTEVFDDY